MDVSDASRPARPGARLRPRTAGRARGPRDEPAAPSAALPAALAAARERLSPAERRVAEVVAGDPEAVAFGTVAQLARRAGTSGASVVRLADRLGYRGFVGLQDAVRRDLRQRLRPAAERIRSAAAGRDDVLRRVLDVELANLRLTLEGLDPRSFGAAVARLAARQQRVFVVASEQARGIGLLFAGELRIVRDGVQQIEGSSFRVTTELAGLGPEDTVVWMDLRRHERWLLEAFEQARTSGAAHIAITDSEFSPLADGAMATLTVAAAGAGPFDSHVGMLAIGNALLAGVAARLQRSLTRRLDALEGVWAAQRALVEPR
ncbi:MurR/RpiR family transcriptional regulator [Myxococcota bacterium]|nr:MurR/RpiR family transcriptional regulator [Myxococcota bacterium]MCZ7619565.1 MurR/RpiR family transcriptional regulator [Myxococcota bacterium]